MTEQTPGQYDFSAIEAKWQAYWLEHKTFKTVLDRSKPKYYVLDMFPYPSGAGLHVGHPEGYTATDIVARFKRMKGFNVLHPMGWDAFGLPAERHAMRTGEHPAVITKTNCDTFRSQIRRLGLSYDWDREIDTTDPKYYRWTQWIFTVLFERGLAYEVEAPVNWCPALGTVLANEEVKDGRYVETGDPVERRMMRQWMLRITAYAERLLRDLDTLDWPEGIKAMQREWIGRSEGADVKFTVAGSGEEFTVFTTRPDTLFGATYCVLAPEHPLTRRITRPEQRAAVEAYIGAASKKSTQDRMREEKDKTGTFTGAYAVNPVNGKEIPIWTADYVLADYGYGAIMAVPAHDTRDYEFAKTFGLDIIEVISGGDIAQEAFTGDGVLVNSPLIDGLRVPDAKKKITAWLEERGIGTGTVNYKLRDWLFSRQRYWGEPFPIIRREDGTIATVPMTDLPVMLPELDEYRPTAEGDPPLARAADWVNTTDPATGKPARRETNTMPQWAGSCWYFLRFCDPRNDDAAWSKEAESYWMPVDLYIGGAEHAVLHLLYARFWHKVLFDAGHVSTAEPFQKLFNQGMILAYSFRNFSNQYLLPERIESISYFSRVSKTNKRVDARIDKKCLPTSCATIDFTSFRSGGGTTSAILCSDPEGYVWRDKSNPSEPLDIIPTHRYLVERRTGKVICPPPDYCIVEGGDYMPAVHGPIVFRLSDGEYYDWSFIDSLTDDMNVEEITLNNGHKVVSIHEVIERIQIEKMSKSRYNVVNPDEVANQYGADSIRLYEMFMGPLDREKPWTDEGVQGVHRFLRRVWSLFIGEDGGLHPRVVASGGDPALVKELHRTVKAVTQNIESLLFNTAIARMMEFVNAALKAPAVDRDVLEGFVLVLSPFAPHLAEELWERLGHTGTLAYVPWPEWDESLLVENILEVPVQVQGKLRGKVEVPADADAATVLQMAKEDPKVAPHLEGKTIVKEIYIPGKMVNLVVK